MKSHIKKFNESIDITPEEKANIIFNVYYSNLTDVLNNSESKEFAHTCSIICIGLIIDSEPNNRVYWRKVKLELLRLSRL